MKRKIICIFVLIAIIPYTVIVAANNNNSDDSVEFYSVNNQYNGIDYKTDEIATISDAEIDLPQNTITVWQDNIGSQNLSDLDKEESWLISHNVISRPFELADKACVIKNYDANDSCPKTLLYSMLYRSYFGPIESRPVLFKDNQDAYNPIGIYYSNNVYELYLKELLDKGYIHDEELATVNGMVFLEDYRKLSTLTSDDASVIWDNRLGYVESVTPGALGSANYYDTTGYLVEQTPSFFNDEYMFTKDALLIIADFVRSSEKDMSELEASIVSYKYGINYIRNVSNDERIAIEFLIAKGILDYEHPEEFLNLYGEFTYKDAYKILYRIANSDARLDFSQITLTDSETFWQSNGYFADSIRIQSGSSLPCVETITEDYWNVITHANPNSIVPAGDSDGTSDPDTYINDILGFGHLVKVNASDMPVFTVVKMFNTAYSYQYKGIPIDSLESSDKRPPEFESYVTQSVNSLMNSTGTNSTVTMAKVVFNIEAKDYASAVLYVDNNITIDNAVNSDDIECFTTIDDDGKEITLISATTIQNGVTDLAIIEDKVLVNKVTGVTAIILPENGYALVGNRIVKSTTLLMTDTSDEVYYNLDIISSLLGNVYLSRLSRGNVLYVCSNIQNEVQVPVYSSTGSHLRDAYIATIDIVDQNTDNMVTGLENAGCFNVDNLEVGTNTLTRAFPVFSGSGQQTVYVIVRWNYVIPDDEILAREDISDFLKQTETTSTNTLTIQQVNEIMYTRPSGNTDLQKWWDSNISVSNSLANFMYGTNGVEYVKSGYLAPSIVILRPSNVSDGNISQLFTSYGFKLDSIGLKYCGSTTAWWETYYSGSTMESDYLKALAISNRGYEIINADEVADGTVYSNKFFVTRAGVIYENVRKNDNVLYVTNRLTLQTRRVSGNVNIPRGTIFTYDNKQWVYEGTQLLSSGLFYCVQPAFENTKFVTSSIIVDKDYGVLPVYSKVNTSNPNSVFSDCVNNMNDMYLEFFGLKDFLYTSFKGSTADGLHVTSSLDMYRASNATVKTVYRQVFGNHWFVDNKQLTNGNVTATPDTGKNYTLFRGDEIQAIPVFYLNANDYYFYGTDGDYYMNAGSLVNALNMNGAYTVGISQSVRDSIIYANTNTVPINYLIEGQIVTIADINFKRIASSNKGNPIFVSEPITDVNLISVLRSNASDEDKLAAVKSYLFTGIQVNYNGQDYYLSSFIKDAYIGPQYNPDNATGVLYSSNGKKGGTLCVFLDAVNAAQDASTTTPSSVCLAIQLEDGLFARPTTEKMNTYVALLYSSIMPNTATDNIPFYTENLSFDDSIVQTVTVENSKFLLSEWFKHAKTNFKKMMHKAFAGDIVTIIWMFIFYFAVYLSIMAWIMWAVLTEGYGRKLFETITLPAKQNGYIRHGFDLIKILTFGIYNIESEPSLGRTFISSFISFFVSYAIVMWRP